MGGGGSAVRKIYCTGPWKLAITPERAHVHNGPLNDIALYVTLLIRATPPLRQVEAVGHWKSRLFWAPNGIRLTS